MFPFPDEIHSDLVEAGCKKDPVYFFVWGFSESIVGSELIASDELKKGFCTNILFFELEVD